MTNGCVSFDTQTCECSKSPFIVHMKSQFKIMLTAVISHVWDSADSMIKSHTFADRSSCLSALI